MIKNNIATVKQLITKGIDVNVINSKTGSTGLYTASMYRNINIINELIKSKADLNILNGHLLKETALMEAAKSKYQLPVLKILMEAGADPNIKNSLGQTALDIAKKYNNQQAEVLLDPHAAASLLQGMVRAKQQRDIVGKTKEAAAKLQAWFEAIKKGDIDTVRKLISEGIDVNARDSKFGYTGLYSATYDFVTETEDDINIINELIKAKADLNLLNGYFEETALMQAAKSKYQLPVLKILIEAGADPNIKNRLGQTALDIAQKKNNKEAELLLDPQAATAASVLQRVARAKQQQDITKQKIEAVTKLQDTAKSKLAQQSLQEKILAAQKLQAYAKKANVETQQDAAARIQATIKSKLAQKSLQEKILAAQKLQAYAKKAKPLDINNIERLLNFESTLSLLRVLS